MTRYICEKPAAPRIKSGGMPCWKTRPDQLPDLAPAAAAPDAWLESEPAWLIAVLK